MLLELIVAVIPYLSCRLRFPMILNQYFCFFYLEFGMSGYLPWWWSPRDELGVFMPVDCLTMVVCVSGSAAEWLATYRFKMRITRTWRRLMYERRSRWRSWK